MRRFFGVVVLLSLMSSQLRANQDCSDFMHTLTDAEFLFAHLELTQKRMSGLLNSGRGEQGDAASVYFSFAMDYPLLGRSKRIRPALVYLAAKEAGLEVADADVMAVAIEELHTASLIFDDLPAMDDASTRRGQPVIHKHKLFGESDAMLAAIALMMSGLDLSDLVPKFGDRAVRQVERYFREAIGRQGLSLGQFMDLRSEQFVKTHDDLERMLHLKTGLGLEVSLVAPFLLIDAKDEKIVKLKAFAKVLGLLYQIQDDILDQVKTEKELGKAVGQDSKLNRKSYVQMTGLEEAEGRLKNLAESALVQAEEIFDHPAPWRALIVYLTTRQN